MKEIFGKNYAAADEERPTDEVDSASFAKALIFLALGFGISWCAVCNWGPSQTKTLVSGVFGLALGAIYLARYFSEKNGSRLAYVTSKSRR